MDLSTLEFSHIYCERIIGAFAKCELLPYSPLPKSVSAAQPGLPAIVDQSVIEARSVQIRKNGATIGGPGGSQTIAANGHNSYLIQRARDTEVVIDL